MTASSARVLVVDVGTSGVRATVVGEDGAVLHLEHAEVLPSSPAPGFVEFDAAEMAGAALGVASRALAAAGPVAAVGVAGPASRLTRDVVRRLAYETTRTGLAVSAGLGYRAHDAASRPRQG